MEIAVYNLKKMNIVSPFKILSVFILLIFISCSKDSDDPQEPIETEVTVTTTDFFKTIDENPTNGVAIGSVSGTTNEGSVSFSITEQTPPGSFSIDSSSGEHVCNISQIISTKNDTAIIVDFVKYLTGIEAHKASIKDGNYEIDNGDTITDITNDYYISNNNTKLRKFSFSSKSTIAIYDYESDGEFKQISIKEFVKRNEDNIDFYELYTIKFSGGKVTELEEIFVP